MFSEAIYGEGLRESRERGEGGEGEERFQNDFGQFSIEFSRISGFGRVSGSGARKSIKNHPKPSRNHPQRRKKNITVCYFKIKLSSKKVAFSSSFSGCFLRAGFLRLSPVRGVSPALSPALSPKAFSGFLRRLPRRKSGQSFWCEEWRKTLSPNFLRSRSPTFSGFLRAGFLRLSPVRGVRLLIAFSGFLRATFSKLSPVFFLMVYF